jgi:hypothetical protein
VTRNKEQVARKGGERANDLIGQKTMMTACISNAIDEDALRLVPIRVGGIRQHSPPPDRFVTVLDSGGVVLRVDVHSHGSDVFAFQEVLIWRNLLLIGFGCHVHLVDMTDHSARTIELGAYFGRFYPTPDYLLIASGERLFRVAPDRTLLWITDVLGIDGVVVHQAAPTVIRGEGEWDPPGGWKPFAISTHDGAFASV